MANFITVIRIACSAAMLFFAPLSPAFFMLYIIAGLTDMLDGAIARKTNTVSAFGSRLDSAADFITLVVCAVKLIPVLTMPIWAYVWAAAIALIRGINVISGYMLYRKTILLHTAANRAAGALLFALPLTLTIIDLKCSAAIVCAVSTFAAIQEGHLIRNGKEIE